MRWAACLLAAFATASPAWSLSCLQPDIARDYISASQADETYIVVKGTLFYDKTALPKRDPMSNSRQRKAVDIPAWLDGHSLTPDGFTRRFERDVILRITCIGPWCGGAEPGPYLAFLKQDAPNFVLQIGPCGNMAYANPTEVQIETVKNCMAGKDCAAE